MSTDKRPGMAINEDEVDRHVEETRRQAARARYPARSTAQHGQAEPPLEDAGARTDEANPAGRPDRERDSRDG
jgi:hypothetical protein